MGERHISPHSAVERIGKLTPGMCPALNEGNAFMLTKLIIPSVAIGLSKYSFREDVLYIFSVFRLGHPGRDPADNQTTQIAPADPGIPNNNPDG